jgi:hypothetical protein
MKIEEAKTLTPFEVELLILLRQIVLALEALKSDD